MLAIPGARVCVVRRVGDLTAYRALDALAGDRPIFVILSKEMAKLGHGWRPAYTLRLQPDADRTPGGAVARLPACPSCGAPILDDEGLPIGRAALERRRRSCRHCRGALWTADRAGVRRFPVARFIRRYFAGHFDLLVADEVHQLKGRGSAQGLAFADLAVAARRTLTATGTLLGGYSSTLFYLLQRTSPQVRREFRFADEARWVARYGVIERTTSKGGDDEAYEDGKASRRKAYRVTMKERPGIAPSLLFELIGNTVFLRLADVSRDLPPYRESPVSFEMEPAQRRAYERLEEALLARLRELLAAGSKRLLGAYVQALLSYPDNCTVAEAVYDRADGAAGDPAAPALVASAPALPANRLYPKETALVELALRQRAGGRRLLTFVTHTESRDLTPRLRRILEEAGLRVAVLKSHTVKAERREAWVEARVAEGVDVLICNPRCVETGLDLLQFPCIAWYELDYSTYSVSQGYVAVP